MDGEREVKIHGQMIPVNARVEQIESMSAHADSMEILRWLGAFKSAPKATFIVHGEPSAMYALNETIHDKLGWETRMPQHKEVVTLDL